MHLTAARLTKTCVYCGIGLDELHCPQVRIESVWVMNSSRKKS